MLPFHYIAKANRKFNELKEVNKKLNLQVEELEAKNMDAIYTAKFLDKENKVLRSRVNRLAHLVLVSDNSSGEAMHIITKANTDLLSTIEMYGKNIRDLKDAVSMEKWRVREREEKIQALEAKLQKVIIHNTELTKELELLKKQNTTNIDIHIQLPGVVHNTVINGKVVKEKD